MFRALLAHPQEVLQNGTWYIACYVSWLTKIGVDMCSNHGAAN
jgi:hypothetical protein